MPWSIPANADAAGATDWNIDMFAGTGGTFTGAPAIGETYYLASGLPAAPAFAADGEGFVIGDGTATIKIDNAESGLWYTVYRVDDLTQTNWVKIGDSIKATGSQVIFTIPRRSQKAVHAPPSVRKNRAMPPKTFAIFAFSAAKKLSSAFTRDPRLATCGSQILNPKS